MKVLIIGSGGREHALAWQIKKSKNVKKIYIAPGNNATADLGENINIKPNNTSGLLKLARHKKINFTVVGPEDPLASGIVDQFNKHNLLIFGPSKKAAKLESSKVFAKQFMKKFNIPTADFKVFSGFKKAQDYIKKQKLPLVIKADGLAAGKGVFVCQSKKEATLALDKIMNQKLFGEAGKKVVIEDRLSGYEASVIAFADGCNILPLLPAQDHKPIFDDDQGPNTGGMGAYAPTPLVNHRMLKIIIKRILKPAVLGMKKLGTPYKGILYAGLMLTEKGPKALEFNCRFGDPETQPQLMLLKSDLLSLMQSCLRGSLKKEKIKWHKGYSVCLVLASKGYPGNYQTGFEIKGLPKKNLADVQIFQAGTKYERGKVKTNGGRVLGITSRASSLKKAINKAYLWAQKIDFKNKYYRTDVGQRPEIKKWFTR
jgi:phosphoribosylamine---glycine ligase